MKHRYLKFVDDLRYAYIDEVGNGPGIDDMFVFLSRFPELECSKCVVYVYFIVLYVFRILNLGHLTAMLGLESLVLPSCLYTATLFF